VRRYFPWPGLIFVFIGTTVVVQSATLFYALGDDSFAVVPDYDAKADAWDQHAAEAQASRTLGWSIIPLGSPIVNGVMSLDLELVGAPGDVIGGWTAYHNAKPQQRFTGTVRSDNQGHITLDISDTRPGWWQIEIELSRGQDRFLHQDKLWLPVGSEPVQETNP